MVTDQKRLHFIILLGLAGLMFALCLSRGGAALIIDGLPFKDSDDILRLLQAQQWLTTGDWFDLSQPRLNPPDGVLMHWSRLPDLPLALLIWLGQPLLGEENAALVAAWLVPALLGVGFFAAFVWAAQPLTGQDGRVYAGLMVLALSIPGTAFAAGRIDHHGWQLVLAAFAAGAALRILAALDTAFGQPIAERRRLAGIAMAADSSRLEGGDRDHLPRTPRSRGSDLWTATASALALLGGLAGALGLWVGAEAIPPVAFSAAVIGLGWLRYGRPGALMLFWYGLALTLAGLLILPLALDPQTIWSPTAPAARACDAFSWVSVGLAAAVLLFALGALLAERRLPLANPLTRATAGLFMALPLLGLLYALFPTCAGGPYAGISPTVEQMITRISEAQSLIALLQTQPATAAQYAVLPLLGLLVCLAMLLSLRHRGTAMAYLPGSLSESRSSISSKPRLAKATMPWSEPHLSLGPTLGLTLLIVGGLLLQFWQLRGSPLANLYAGLACAAWAAAVGARIRPSQSILVRLLRRAGPVIIVGLLPMLSTLAVERMTGAPAATGAQDVAETTETAKSANINELERVQDTDCDLRAVANRLNQPDLRAQGPLLIAAPLNLGAPLLWLTPHQVLAAPYHRNARGIEDAQQIFFADGDSARAVVERRGVDLLLICPHDPVATYERKEGVTLFYDQLRDGARPDWLSELPFDGNARILKTFQHPALPDRDTSNDPKP